MSKLKLTFLTLLSWAVLLNATAQQPKWVNENPDLLNYTPLINTGRTLQEKIELQQDYWTLLGVIDDLSKYRALFMADPQLINLFPTAYYHTTVTEMQAIASGKYQHPIEKMKQMIAFYEAYKFNRTNWELKNPAVEAHWKQHFEFAATSAGCPMVGLVLSTAIAAHIRMDLPRALQFAYDNRFDRALKPADIQPDFDASDPIFAVTVKKTLQDVSANSLCPPGTMEKVMTFDASNNHVLIALVNTMYNTYHDRYPTLFGFLGVQRLYTDETVISLRHKAWSQAFRPSGSAPSTAVPQPGIHNEAYLAARGRAICGIAAVGSISPGAKLISADKGEPFSEGYAVVSKGTRQAMLDGTGDIFIPYGKFLYGQYETAGGLGYHNGLCKVYQQVAAPYYKLYGFIDLQQQLTVPYKYVYTNFATAELGFGRLPAPNDKPLNLIDRTGRELGVDLMNSGLRTDGNRIALVVKEQGHGEQRRYGFVDYTGKVRIPVTYIRAHAFSEGLAAVKKGTYDNAKWGFIAENGAVVIPFSYDIEPGDFHDGRAMIVTGSQKDKTGSTLFNYTYLDKRGRPVAALAQRSRNILKENKEPELWTAFSGGYLAMGDPVGGDRNEGMLLDTNGVKTDLSLIDTYYKTSGKIVTAIHTYSTANADEFYMLKKDFGQLPLQVEHGLMLIDVYRPKDRPGEGKTGMITVRGDCVMPPVFNQLSSFDAASELAYAELQQDDGKIIKGYIGINGLFKIILQ